MQFPYDDPVPAMKAREALADVWNKDNLDGQRTALAGHLHRQARDLFLARHADDVAGVRTELLKILTEVDDIEGRMR